MEQISDEDLDQAKAFMDYEWLGTQVVSASQYAAVARVLRSVLNELHTLKHDIGEYVRISSEQATEIERLRRQLEWVEAYAQDTLNTNSKDMDDWRGDVHHIANSARAALSQGEQK